MRIAICDDNPFIIDELTKYLEDYFRKNKLTMPELCTFSNGESLLASKLPMDIIFLDIEMTGVDGIYVANQIKRHSPKAIIIIVTSFAEYLDEAMRIHVFRYLSKPIDKQRLFRNLKNAIFQYNETNSLIAIETKDGVYSISTSDIVCVEAQMRKVLIHTQTTDFVSIHNMQYWLDKLSDPCFFQSHRSFIVNFHYISNFNHSLIHLCNNQFTAYLTRRKYSEFKHTYLIYLESTR